MSAAPEAQERGKGATIQLRNDLFDELTARQGAGNEIERAHLVGIDRTTLYRLRARKYTASLEVAMRMAERLGTTVDDLFEATSS